MSSNIYSRFQFNSPSNQIHSDLLRISNEPVREKTNNLDPDQVRHKPGCTVTEDGKRLEILYVSRRGIVLSV